MDTKTLPCVEVDPPGQKSAAAVIWLHGIGADGYDFEPMVPQLRLPEMMAVRFVFPHAPKRDITLHGSIPSRAWFDILNDKWPRTPENVNLDDIRQSADQVDALIRKEINSGIPSRRIVLAGFSQGGAIALHAGLRFPMPLAGIMALSTYLPTLDSLAPERSEVNLGVPVFMAHGSVDPTVPIADAFETKDGLEKLNYSVEWHEYHMVHSICVDEIEDIRSWLLNIL
jgi:phospholipase/carboxylesterase